MMSVLIKYSWTWLYRLVRPYELKICFWWKCKTNNSYPLDVFIMTNRLITTFEFALWLIIVPTNTNGLGKRTTMMHRRQNVKIDLLCPYVHKARHRHSLTRIVLTLVYACVCVWICRVKIRYCVCVCVCVCGGTVNGMYTTTDDTGGGGGGLITLVRPIVRARRGWCVSITHLFATVIARDIWKRGGRVGWPRTVTYGRRNFREPVVFPASFRGAQSYAGTVGSKQPRTSPGRPKGVASVSEVVRCTYPMCVFCLIRSICPARGSVR